MYAVKMKAMKIRGSGWEYVIDSVVVKADQTTAIEHHFITGLMKIGCRGGGALIDAVVNVKDVQTGKSEEGGRTYTAESSNPNTYILTPGTYEVTVKPVREFKGNLETFQLTVIEGQTVERMIDF
jgi:hypothetical protein